MKSISRLATMATTSSPNLQMYLWSPVPVKKRMYPLLVAIATQPMPFPSRSSGSMRLPPPATTMAFSPSSKDACQAAVFGSPSYARYSMMD